MDLDLSRVNPWVLADLAELRDRVVALEFDVQTAVRRYARGSWDRRTQPSGEDHGKWTQLALF